MNVAAILRKKGRAVVTADMDTTLLDVTRTMIGQGVGSIVVLNKSGTVAGLISERDIVRLVAEDGVAGLGKSIDDCLKCLSRHVPVCQESDSVSHLMGEMTEQRARHIPVVERGRLVGIVSIGDVVKERIFESEMEAEAMRNYITAG